MSSNTFQILNAVDVSKHIEKKQNLSYLSWAWAWSTVKGLFPETVYKIYENVNGLNYHTDGMTAWVKVGVTIKEVEYIEYLPVMDFRNKSIALGGLTSMDVNKAIQRALTKAIARHGLGLYIYAGEDLPEQGETTQEKPKLAPPSKASSDDKKQAWKDFQEICETMGVDAIEFLSADIDMEDKTLVYGTVRKWLNSEDLLKQQLINFKNS